VYDLPPACVRLDRTSANGSWRVTEDGLFQLGHRQDHRPDLPQVKIMVSALDPLGMPVATDVVPGQRADAPRYSPAIARGREGLGRQGRRDVGACTMAALATRAFLQAGGDTYVCPLSETPLPPVVLADDLAPVWAEEQVLTVRPRAPPGGPSPLSAEGVERWEPVTAEVAGQAVRWRERRLVIRSCQLAQAGERGLRARLAKAQAAIPALQTRGRGRRRCAAPSAVREAGEAILARDRGPGLRHVR
jgi:transposase